MLSNIITTAPARYFHTIPLQELILIPMFLIFVLPGVENKDFTIIIFTKRLRQWGSIQNGQIYVAEIAAGMDSAQRLLLVLPLSPFAVMRSFNGLCSLPSIKGNIFPVLLHLHITE